MRATMKPGDLRVRPKATYTGGFRVPYTEWAVMPEQHRREMWQEADLRAVRGARERHPSGVFFVEYEEHMPSALEILESRTPPDFVGKVVVTLCDIIPVRGVRRRAQAEEAPH
jgi:hypothetical protein